MATRDELVAAVVGRYGAGSRAEKGRILDEFVAVTGFHRKHAMRVLRGGRATRRSAPRPERRLYDQAVREALIVIWEASDRVCGKRLKPLSPILIEAMERHGHLQLAPEIRTRLLAMSAATMDRALRAVRAQAGGGIRRRAAPSSAVRRSVPVRTFADWHDPPPGFVEAVPPAVCETPDCMLRGPCRSIASTRMGASAFSRLPQTRSDASQSTISASRTAPL